MYTHKSKQKRKKNIKYLEFNVPAIISHWITPKNLIDLKKKKKKVVLSREYTRFLMSVSTLLKKKYYKPMVSQKRPFPIANNKLFYRKTARGTRQDGRGPRFPVENLSKRGIPQWRKLRAALGDE